MIKVWIGSLAAYNEGRLVGDWYTLPVDPAELKHLGEETFVADSEVDSMDNLPIKEHSNLATLNDWAERLNRLRDDELARIDYLLGEGYSFDDAMAKYEDVTFYADQTLKQVAEELIDEGCFGDIPAAIAGYINYDAIARDLGFDGYTETSAGVFHYC